MRRRFLTALPWALAAAAWTVSVASAGFGPAQGGATGSGGTITATNVVGGTAHAVAVEQGGVAPLNGVGPVASGSLLGSAGVSSDPAFVALGKMLDVLGATPGSILYRGTTTAGWRVLTPGSNTNVLTLAGGVPTWTTSSSTSLNPTTSIITLGAGLAAIQLVGPSDADFRIRPGGSNNLLLDTSAGASLALNNSGFIQLSNNNRVVLQADAGDGLSLRDVAGVAAVWSGTLETRLGGTIAQPTQVSQAASVTLDTTAGTWNANSAIAQTYTLPDATSCAGRIYKIKQTGAGVLTLATTSSQNIDGSTTYVFPARYVSLEVQSDGAQWWIY